MNDRAWFRLAVRVVGILVLGVGAPRAIEWLLYAIRAFARGEIAQSDAIDVFLGFVAALVQTCFGIYLLFFANGLIVACLRDSIGRCGACQYDLRGCSGSVCPECGMPVATAPPLA